MSFQPGDIVECVDARPGRMDGCTSLVLGKIYSVEVSFSPELFDDGIGAVHLFGITNTLPWCESRFRLLKRHDPDLIAKLFHEPAPVDLVAA